MRIALLAVALVALLALAAPPAWAADPIEGTWHFAGGKVRVEPTGPGTFRGTVVERTRFALCDHPVGERMWSVEAEGAAYRGTHLWYRRQEGCASLLPGPAIWRVREEAGRYALDFCTTPPGSPPPAHFGDGECSTLQRARPVAPDPRRTCSGGTCLQGPPAPRGSGCLPRSVRHTFRVRSLVRRRGRSVARIRGVVFRLDGRRVGSDRRPPFAVALQGSLLRPGRHTLRAAVSLRSTRTGRGYRRTLSYRFRACRR